MSKKIGMLKKFATVSLIAKDKIETQKSWNIAKP